MRSSLILPYHPRTGLLAVGFRKDGRPIWPIMGGDPVGGDNALLQRLTREHEDLDRQLDSIYATAEREARDLTDAEREMIVRHKDRKGVLDAQITPLLEAEEQKASSNALRARIAPAQAAANRGDGTPDGDGGGVTLQVRDRDQAPAWLTADPTQLNRSQVGLHRVTPTGRRYVDSPYHKFAEFARDALISRYDAIMARAGGPEARKGADERLKRVPPNTLTSDVAGLLPPTHMAQIMDVIDMTRPLVASARSIELDNGKLTYPKITSRPTVGKQAAEKTEATPYTKLGVSMETITAETFLGAGDLSWQAMNWSTPSALELWFDLCAEDYARKTEAEAGSVLNTATTASTALTGTTIADSTIELWWGAIIGAAQAVYAATGSRVLPNTIWTSPDRFFTLMRLLAPQGTQPALSALGSLDLSSFRGNIAGLTIVGTHGLPVRTTIIGDSRAVLVGEMPGNPVEMRAVEPAIGGMEVGLIGAFKAQVFDATRFHKLTNANF